MGNNEPCPCAYRPKMKKKRKTPSCGAYAPFFDFLAFFGALLRDLDDHNEALLAALVPVVPILSDPFSCAMQSLESEDKKVAPTLALATALFGATAAADAPEAAAAAAAAAVPGLKTPSAS
jgi:hypothetical protein